MPLVLGVLEGDGDGPGVLFDAHFDTVHARPGGLGARPVGRSTSRTASSTGAARSTARARTSRCSRRSSRSSRSGQAAQRPDLLHVGLRRRGRLPRRRADGRPRRDAARRHDLLGRGDEQHAASRSPTRASRPGRSRRSAAPRIRPSPRSGINAITKMAKLVEAVDAGPARDPARHLELVRAARDRAGDPHPARRRLDDPRPLRRGDLGACRPPARRSTRCASRSTAFLRELERRTARSATSSRCCRWAPAGCGCARARATRRPRACKALEQAVRRRARRAGEVRKFNGGWVDAVELDAARRRRVRRRRR